jgi:hypothetical protein
LGEGERPATRSPSSRLHVQAYPTRTHAHALAARDPLAGLTTQVSVCLQASLSGACMRHCEVSWNLLAMSEVHFVGRLDRESGMWNDRVVWLHVEADSAPRGGEVQGYQAYCRVGVVQSIALVTSKSKLLAEGLTAMFVAPVPPLRNLSTNALVLVVWLVAAWQCEWSPVKS